MVALVTGAGKCTHLTLDLCASRFTSLSCPVFARFRVPPSLAHTTVVSRLTLVCVDRCEFAPLVNGWPSLTALELVVYTCAPDHLDNVWRKPRVARDHDGSRPARRGVGHKVLFALHDGPEQNRATQRRHTLSSTILDSFVARS
jgi:hypothetical protein